jgi:hypothetical protein
VLLARVAVGPPVGQLASTLTSQTTLHGLNKTLKKLHFLKKANFLQYVAFATTDLHENALMGTA